MNILLHGMNVLNKLVLVACVQKSLDSGKFLGFRGGSRIFKIQGGPFEMGEDNYSGGVETPIGGMRRVRSLTGL